MGDEVFYSGTIGRVNLLQPNQGLGRDDGPMKPDDNSNQPIEIAPSGQAELTKSFLQSFSPPRLDSPDESGRLSTGGFSASPKKENSRVSTPTLGIETGGRTPPSGGSMPCSPRPGGPRRAPSPSPPPGPGGGPRGSSPPPPHFQRPPASSLASLDATPFPMGPADMNATWPPPAGAPPEHIPGSARAWSQASQGPAFWGGLPGGPGGEPALGGGGGGGGGAPLQADRYDPRMDLTLASFQHQLSLEEISVQGRRRALARGSSGGGGGARATPGKKKKKLKKKKKAPAPYYGGGGVAAWADATAAAPPPAPGGKKKKKLKKKKKAGGRKSRSRAPGGLRGGPGSPDAEAMLGLPPGGLPSAFPPGLQRRASSWSPAPAGGGGGGGNGNGSVRFAAAGGSTVDGGGGGRSVASGISMSAAELRRHLSGHGLQGPRMTSARSRSASLNRSLGRPSGDFAEVTYGGQAADMPDYASIGPGGDSLSHTSSLTFGTRATRRRSSGNISVLTYQHQSRALSTSPCYHPRPGEKELEKHIHTKYYKHDTHKRSSVMRFGSAEQAWEPMYNSVPHASPVATASPHWRRHLKQPDRREWDMETLDLVGTRAFSPVHLLHQQAPKYDHVPSKMWWVQERLRAEAAERRAARRAAREAHAAAAAGGSPAAAAAARRKGLGRSPSSSSMISMNSSSKRPTEWAMMSPRSVPSGNRR